MKKFIAPKLFPCAHCGSEDAHLTRLTSSDGHDVCIAWMVECYECGIRTQPYEEEIDNGDMDDYTFAHVAMDDAIYCAVNSWNTRV